MLCNESNKESVFPENIFTLLLNIFVDDTFIVEFKVFHIVVKYRKCYSFIYTRFFIKTGKMRSLGQRRLGGFISFTCIWILVVLLLGNGFLPAVLLSPVSLGLPAYYIYSRMLKPFVHNNVPHRTLRITAPVYYFFVSETEAVAIYTVLVFYLICVIPFAFVRDGSPEPLLFVVIGYNLSGSLLYLLVILVLLDICELVFRVCRWLNTDATRPFVRTYPNRAKATAGIIAYFLVLLTTLLHSYSKPDTVYTDVFIRHLPPCVDGYRLLLISDTHIGMLVGGRETYHLVNQANSLAADAIALVGDITDGTPSRLQLSVAPLAHLSARDGVFFVPGNHEYMYGSTGREWMQHYKTLGITGLNNSRVRLAESTKCTGFNLAGVDDLSVNRSNVTAATANSKFGDTTILLAHQPSVSRQAAQNGAVDLQLSGHTHAGQIWPIHLFTYLINTHFAGLETDEGEMYVYTSHGAFAWGPRVRLFSSNNIDLITLRVGPHEKNPPSNYAFLFMYLSIPFYILTTMILIYWFFLFQITY